MIALILQPIRSQRDKMTYAAVTSQANKKVNVIVLKQREIVRGIFKTIRPVHKKITKNDILEL